MLRLHLFEWEDQDWFPDVFRRFITDHLLFHGKRLYRPVTPKLVDLLKRSGHENIVDLCSGAGGPIPKLLPELSTAMGKPIRATLTDLYPNPDIVENTNSVPDDSLKYRAQSTSAMECLDDLEGARTIFTALHHFHPRNARKILANAVNKEVPICVFEFTERNIFKFFVFALGTFLSSFILTPFVGRMTFARFVLTYVIPACPIFLSWDGLVSCLRTYTPKELGMLTRDLTQNGYKWESGRISVVGHIGPYNITYLIGVPREANHKVKQPNNLLEADA